MTKKIDLPLILLAVAAFLAPLIGGQIATDALSLDPSANSLVMAVLGSPEVPTLSHAILTLLCSIAIIILLWQRKIVQVPNNTVSGLLVILFGIIAASVGYSEFRSTSIPAALEWLAYGTAFYAVVAGTGRQRGPLILLSAMFAGCVLLALLGIQDYGANKAVDPTWRIMPQWVGPNALAAMLMIGFFIGLGLAIVTDRLASIAICVGCIAIGVAIFLTQSKGAILAMAACILVYAVLLIAWLPRKNLGRSLGIGFAVVAFIALLAGAMSFRPTASPSPGPVAGAPQASVGSPLGRLENSSTSMDQSVGFRKLLWQSAIKLIESDPVGSGIGTFQYESARPGLVTQTHMAHEAYLQLAEEVSPLALILLVAAIGYWSILVSKGGSKLDSKQNVLRASVATAVAGVLFHNFVDSNLSYFGIGLSFFMLLGVGLLLSTDAVAPEFLPTILRRVAITGIAAFTAFMVFLGFTEGMRAQVRAYLPDHYNDAQNLLESLRSMTPWDADVYSLSLQSSRTAAEQLQYAKRASELAPSTHNLRMLARVQDVAGLESDARSSLNKVLQKDPNNMLALQMLARIETKSGFDDEAKKTLEKLVDVEQTSYFKIRSLPELVATETYEARIELAMGESGPDSKIKWLPTAIDGFKQYAAHTVQNVIRFAKSPGGRMEYGGESVDRAKTKMTEAETAAKELAAAYRAVGNPALASAADADSALFAGVLDSLSFK